MVKCTKCNKMIEGLTHFIEHKPYCSGCKTKELSNRLQGFSTK